MKTGDIRAVFNAIKPERYKVKSISEAVGNSGIILALNQGDGTHMLENEIKALFEGKNNDKISFLIDDNLSKTFGADTNKVFISAYDIKSHSNKNLKRKITYIDYFYASQALSNNKVINKFKDGDCHIILIGDYENTYRIVLKVTKNKQEIFMPSVVKITDVKSEIEKLKRNKQEF